MPDLETLMGEEGKFLEEKIMVAPDNQMRARILSDFLEKRLLKNQGKEPGVFTAINYIIHTRGLVTVDKMADKYCLSRRQFERKFKESAGFSPKLYSRIIRFGEALNQYGKRTKSLTEIAYECGYYDQSHFIHDFKEFSGYYPKEYFYGQPEGMEYREV